VKKLAIGLTLVAGLGLSACTDPYDPGQRAVGGGLLGAGAGAGTGAGATTAIGAGAGVGVAKVCPPCLGPVS